MNTAQQIHKWLTRVSKDEPTGELASASIEMKFPSAFFNLQLGRVSTKRFADEFKTLAKFKSVDEPLLYGYPNLAQELDELADELTRQKRDAHIAKVLRKVAREVEFTSGNEG